MWPSLESVSMARKDDPRFEAQVVYLPCQHPNKSTDLGEYDAYIKRGIPVIRHDAYDLTQEAPDVVVYCKPYDEILPKKFAAFEVEKIVDRMVYIPYGMELSTRLYRYGYQQYLHYSAWRHIVYGEGVLKHGMQHGYRNGENIVAWGHPKADLYRPERQWPIPKAWEEKIKGRRVLLWCPHHTVKPGPEKVSTFIEFHEAVFRAVEKHPDLVLLWRPHLMMFGALVNNGFYTQEEMDRFAQGKYTKENIILDTAEDYGAAVDVSDGLITDGTTFALEYLYTEKPYMVTTLDMSSFYEPEVMEDALYIGKNEEAIEEFVDLVSRGEDPKREKRLAWKRKTVFMPEQGTVGQHIAQQIIDTLTQEEARLDCLEGKK